MKFFSGVMTGVVLVAVCGYFFLVAGGMPVSTEGGPLPFEVAIAHQALAHAIGKEADRPSPFPADEMGLLKGARVYQKQCAVCHGSLDQKPTAIAAGMFPMPPQLLPPKKGVTDDPVGETYWKVKNGIRLTGMPGFKKSLSEEEMWLVSQLLLKADQLPEPVKQILRETRHN